LNRNFGSDLEGYDSYHQNMGHFKFELAYFHFYKLLAIASDAETDGELINLNVATETKNMPIKMTMPIADA